MSKNKKIVVLLLICAFLLILIPLMLQRGSEFSGSDTSGSQTIEEVDPDYQPWFTPVMERFLGHELPGELETLFFCIQTGIGVGILSFAFGYLVARKKYKGTD